LSIKSASSDKKSSYNKSLPPLNASADFSKSLKQSPTKSVMPKASENLNLTTDKFVRTNFLKENDDFERDS